MRFRNTILVDSMRSVGSTSPIFLSAAGPSRAAIPLPLEFAIFDIE